LSCGRVIYARVEGLRLGRKRIIMRKSDEYEKISEIEYGEFSPEVVINPNPEIMTVEKQR
jgi:hypothetical protein